MLIEDFKKVNSALALLLSSNPDVRNALTDEKLVALPIELLESDFKYAFGTELAEMLPKFSKNMSLAATKGYKATRKM